MKRIYSLGALFIPLLAFICAPISNARAASILRAIPSGGYTSGTCSDWATACTLTYAISIAADGDEIWVKKGKYSPGSARGDTFNLQTSVALYGGFAGTETSQDQRDPDSNLTILSGDVSGDDTTDANGVVIDYTDIDGDDNNYSVVEATNVTGSLVMDGFTITAGYANSDDGYLGGGFYGNVTNLILNNMHFSGNYALTQGGAIYLFNGDLTISNSEFLGNGVKYTNMGAGGGAISFRDGSLVLTNVDFIRNIANYSAAIYKYDGSSTMTDVGFYGNKGYYGGIVDLTSNSDKLTNVAFVGNVVESSTYGAIRVQDSTTTITNGTFASNSRNGSCGNSPTLRLVNSIFDSDSFYNCSSFITTSYTSLGVDPGFVRDPSYGADETWGTEDDDYGDLNLIPTSTMIDAGNNNASNLSGVTTDLEGKARFVNVTTVPDTGSGTPPIVDRGAYESDGIAADLVAVLSNDASDEVFFGDSFNWKITTTNSGMEAASFSTGEIILTDNLPSSGATYGSPVVQNASGISGTINCAIASNTLNCSANGNVVINSSGGKFDVAFSVTPTTPGILTNPRSGGSCKVDPNDTIIETGETNNNCNSNTVNVIASDLVVSLVNDVSGEITLGNTFTWTLTVTNTDPLPASFDSAQVILLDDLPSSGATYGVPVVQNSTGITGTINCNITSNTLTCSANGAVTMDGSGGKFEVAIPVTPTIVGVLSNPRSGGSCSVDPNDVVIETKETNNDCNSDSVTVIAPDLIARLVNDVSGQVAYGDTFTWTLTVSNTGTASASFTSMQDILQDDLPATGATYGAPVIQNTNGITGSIDCNISGNTLTCSANSSVTMASPGSKFEVAVPVTPSILGALNNPRSEGACLVDPGNALVEINETNNGCNSDTVTVIAPDLIISLANDVSDEVIIGKNFTWTLMVTNTDLASANFTSTQVIFQDDLPSSGAIFGTPTVQNSSGVTGVIDCTIASNILTCLADGSVTLGASGSSFEVTIPVTPTTAGTLTNPRSSGFCSVDPDDEVVETDETNNNCNSDTVTVNKAASILTTEIHDSEHNPITSAPIGALVHGQATVSGPTGVITPTGAITLTIYDNTTCTGTPVTAQPQILTNGVAESDSLPAQSFFYTVVYGGDDIYLTDSQACTLFSAYQPGPTFTVNTTADDEFDYLCSDVHCTLREAITAANEMAADNTILFDVGNDQIITLTSALPQIMDEGGALTINGETYAITVSGDNLFRVFNVAPYGIHLTLQNLTVANGAANNGGGIYLDSSSYLTLSQVTVYSNTATTDGAGLYINSSSSAVLTNVTFANNQAASNGGAIYNTGGSLSLNNVTMSANSSGIYESSGFVSIQNSILWGNTGYQFISNGEISDISNSVFQGGCPANSLCTNVISTNPLLGALGDYGGSSPTLPLLPGSSAIDANNGSDPCAATDQRGISRPQNDFCDFGAFESQGFILGDLSGTPQHTPINTAFSSPLALTVTANGALDPVAGGLVTFTPPSSGSSATLSGSQITISASGAVSATATANDTVGGPYNVVVNASGADSINFSLTNDKIPVIVILSNLNQVYDGIPKAVSVDTDPAGFDVDVTYNGSSTAPSNAGIYTVVGTVIHTNYQGVATDTLTINTRPITVTAVTDSKPYDGSVTSNSAPTITDGSLAVGDTASWTQTFDTKDVGSGKTLTPAGTISDGNDGDNYDVTYVPVTTGEITAVPLTVKAEDTHKFYLDPLPAFTAVYTGFVGGDTVDDLGGTLAFSTTATQTSPIGDYDVMPGGLSSTNYIITFQKGFLHILPASDLELTKSASANPTLAGADLTYTLVAANHGPNDGSSVTITDTLPVGVSFLSASSDCSENTGVVTCKLGNLASGASFTSSIRVNVDTSKLGTMTNAAVITGNEGDKNTDNNNASANVLVVPSITLYDNDFEDGIGDYWCSDVSTSATPANSRRFLGEFDTQEHVCFSIPDIQDHTLVTLSFDLFIIRSWDGDFNDGRVGADRWRITETNAQRDAINTLLDTTFSNWIELNQSYPGSYPGDQYLSLTGADEINTLGYLWGTTPMDSVYDMEYTIEHNEGSLNLNFLADGFQDINDESWGLDNIRIIISAGAEFLPNSVFMPVLFR